jgi:hypothetical protein
MSFALDGPSASGPLRIVGYGEALCNQWRETFLSQALNGIR